MTDRAPDPSPKLSPMRKSRPQYEIPAALELLKLYLQQKNFDISTLRSDRHFLDVLLRETGLHRRFPRKGSSVLPTLKSIHRELFPNAVILTKKRRSHIRGIGSVGPASMVRSVPDDVRLMIEQKANGI